MFIDSTELQQIGTLHLCGPLDLHEYLCDPHFPRDPGDHPQD